MKKTVKRKVIAGTVVVGLLSSTGVAFGATDAGAGLKSWYDAKFKKASTEVALETSKHSAEKFIELASEEKKLKQGATTDINQTRDAETEAATGRIYQEGRDYITSVNNKKAEIQSNIDSEFQKIEETANKALKVASQLSLATAEFDLKRHTGAEGKAALKYLNDEIEKTTNQSLSDLEWEITTTKQFLQDLLNEKSGATITTINTTVDTEIARILGLITKKTEELVGAQQAVITAKAGELENAAKQKLENRVIELINAK